MPDLSPNSRSHVEVDLTNVDESTKARIFSEFGLNGSNIQEARERLERETGIPAGRVLVMKTLLNEPFHATTKAGVALSREKSSAVIYKGVPDGIAEESGAESFEDYVATELRGVQLLGVALPHLDEDAVVGAAIRAQRESELRRVQNALDLMKELSNLDFKMLPQVVDWLARLEVLCPPSIDSGNITARFAEAGFDAKTAPWENLAMLPVETAARRIIEQALQDIADYGFPTDVAAKRNTVPGLAPGPSAAAPDRSI